MGSCPICGAWNPDAVYCLSCVPPCDHPHECITSSGTTNHCGWCEAIARAEAAEKRLAEANQRIKELEVELKEINDYLAEAACATWSPHDES